MPVHDMFKLFDSLVGSILSYSSVVWIYSSAKHVAGIYGELCRWPLVVNRKVSIIKYWANLIGDHGTLQHQHT
jgi:hypothetical protein